MLVDLFDLSDRPDEGRGPGRFRDYDIVIVGSGPAGISLAVELADSGLNVVVLESGRYRPRPETDRLRAVVSSGIEIKDHSRERLFGGTSVSWAGLSAPLDSSNLTPPAGVAVPGWPLTYDDLRPYYQAASARFGFPPLELFEDDGLAAVRARSELAPDWDQLDERPYLAARVAPHFGREHRATFEADGVDVLLGAHALHLVISDQGDAEAVAVRVPSGEVLHVKARVFVLATGGIENARLLLRSASPGPGGHSLGNESDQVGRYLMNHPKNPAGIVELEQPVREAPHLFGCLHDRWAGYVGLHLRPDTRGQRGLLDCYVRFEPIYPWSDREGVEALLTLVKQSSFILDRFAKRQHGKVVSMRDYAETGDESDLQNARRSRLDWAKLLLKIGRDLRWVTSYAYYRLRKGASPPVTRIRLRNFIEMEPVPDNRVTLSSELDPFGEPLAAVHHACTDLDRRSLVATHETLQAEIERLGLGKLVEPLVDRDPWPIDRDASHHMGTTRMGTDPATSVVDADCRLHTCGNVYVAGCSVFPTSGVANPTYTIVALSVRLADHLRKQLVPGGGPA